MDVCTHARVRARTLTQAREREKGERERARESRIPAGAAATATGAVAAAIAGAVPSRNFRNFVNVSTLLHVRVVRCSTTCTNTTELCYMHEYYMYYVTSL